ncbi:MAG: hypothetical protein ABI162_11995 [Luteolibacter sp.]
MSAMQVIHGEPSFHLATPEVDIYVTERGGQMAPVIFHLSGRNVSPYSLAPWLPAEYPEIPPLLSVLRGDFLCLPFGSQTDGPPHGETANFNWTKLKADSRSMRVMMEAFDTGATVVKTISTRAHHHAIYFNHEISLLEGDFSYGNHPILDFSCLPEGAGRVTTSPFHWASVFPGLFSNPENGESQALEVGAVFQDLHDVKLANGGTTDLTRYPSRAGNEDLVMVAHEPVTDEQPFAWSAAVMGGYVWLSMKNPADFPCTILWISNGGRTTPPWNGRHVGRMGIEDVCSHFADGVDKSRLGLLENQAVPTTRNFRKNEVVTLRNIHAVAAVPEGFGEVRRIIPAGENAVRVSDDDGIEVIVTVDWSFVV